MKSRPSLPTPKDKTLFTPGPLTTSLEVKQAMLRDIGSRQPEFIETIRWIREKLLEAARVSPTQGFECILMQGSGTFGIESVLATVIPPAGKLLVLANGAYGERMARMADYLHIAKTVLRSPENEPLNLNRLRGALETDPAVTHVAAVHCETTTGLLNPITEIGRIVKERSVVFIVDAMSSFGAIPLDFAAAGVDFLISSANKCLEGVPGFSFVLGRRSLLEAAAGHARSLSLDLLAQWQGLEKNGQFRFTPPTQALLAFQQALREFELEGGVSGRAARYQANHAALMEGMKRLGLKPYLRPEVQSYIITSFHYPQDPKFNLSEFNRRLNEKGMVIYPGKLSDVDCFRVGSIGRIFPADMAYLVTAIAQTLAELGVEIEPDTPG